MQSESDWVGRIDEDEELGAAERYAYFMRPEPREDLGPIEEIDDPYLGPKTLVRRMKIGMVRNAKDENKKEVLAYLRPFPHIRIDKAKELQGWYQSLYNESAASRPRPCFTEAVLTEPYGGYCAVGCAFSLPTGEKVNTPYGFQPIESFQVGDWVYGRTTSGYVRTKVTGKTRHWKPEGLVIVSLSDGRKLTMTGDHPVYSRDRLTWVSAECLKEGERLEDETVSRLSGLDQALSDSLRGLRLEDSRSERFCEEGETVFQQRETEIGRNSTENVGTRYQQSGVYERASERTEDARVEIGSSGESQSRNKWIPSVEAARVYRPTGENVQDEIDLGKSSCEVSRFPRAKLGLRTVFHIVAGWFGLHSGFRSSANRNYLRGQGLPHAGRRREDTVGEGNGLQDRCSNGGSSEKARHPYVVGIEKVPGGVWVHDIQTETGNFYHNGILVHNCYINSGMKGYRGTGLISVPLNYGDQIRDQLRKMRRSAAGYFSSFTDPFTPLEAFYHNTENAARAFVDAGLPIFFLSRLRYPEWAVDLLTRSPYSYAQKSINTSNPDDWRKLSPGALPLEDHFADISRLKDAGIYVSIQVNPIVPGVTSHADIVYLFKRLKEAGADHVIVKFVEAGYSWAPAMVERMKKRFPVRGEAFAALFTQNIGSQRTVEEKYRLEGHKLYSSIAARHGLTYATCYEYKYARDESGNILSKTGVSVGREYTTADQCHGHSVPMFTRNTENEPFAPVEACPPTGCLYCASENEGQPRCGDELAGEAPAIKLSDMKQPIGAGKGRKPDPSLIQLGLKKPS